MTDERFPSQLPWAQANTLEAVASRLARLHERWDEASAFCFAARGRSNGNYLGLVTITNTEPDVWAIAYMIAPSEWGRGYATECSQCILDLGFERLRASRIWAGAAGWNASSLRVAEKLGMRHFRSNPRGYQIDGRTIPTEDYEITVDEWGITT